MLVPTVGDRILRDLSLCFRNNRFHLVDVVVGRHWQCEPRLWLRVVGRPAHVERAAVCARVPRARRRDQRALELSRGGRARPGRLRLDVRGREPARLVRGAPAAPLLRAHVRLPHVSPPRELHPAGRHERAALHGGPSTPSYIDAMVLPLGVDDTKELRPRRYLLLYKDERLGVSAARVDRRRARRRGRRSSPSAIWKGHCAEGRRRSSSDGMIHVLYDRYRLDDCAHFCKDVTPRYGSPLQASGEWRVRVRGGERPRLLYARAAPAAPSAAGAKLRALLATGALVGAARRAPPPPRPLLHVEQLLVGRRRHDARGRRGRPPRRAARVRGRDHEGEKGCSWVRSNRFETYTRYLARGGPPAAQSCRASTRSARRAPAGPSSSAF